MNRREFLQVITLPFLAVALPIQAVAAPGELEPVQYGKAVAITNCRDTEMPADLREMLDAYAADLSAQVARPIVSREYVWLPSGSPDTSDPLGQRAWAGIKFDILVPIVQRDAEFAAAGWKPMDQIDSSWRYKDIEFADRWVRGKPLRYARLVDRSAA